MSFDLAHLWSAMGLVAKGVVITLLIMALMSLYVGIERWVLEGTDYVYPRTTNRILEAYLKQKGVAEEDISINYTPFGHSDWQTRVSAIRRFGSAGKATAVVSTINGDANVPFYLELANQEVSAEDIPVIAFSVGEEELSGQWANQAYAMMKDEPSLKLANVADSVTRVVDLGGSSGTIYEKDDGTFKKTRQIMKGRSPNKIFEETSRDTLKTVFTKALLAEL